MKRWLFEWVSLLGLIVLALLIGGLFAGLSLVQVGVMIGAAVVGILAWRGLIPLMSRGVINGAMTRSIPDNYPGLSRKIDESSPIGKLAAGMFEKTGAYSDTRTHLDETPYGMYDYDPYAIKYEETKADAKRSRSKGF